MGINCNLLIWLIIYQHIFIIRKFSINLNLNLKYFRYHLFFHLIFVKDDRRLYIFGCTIFLYFSFFKSLIVYFNFMIFNHERIIF
jgi:hypothetical protein